MRVVLLLAVLSLSNHWLFKAEAHFIDGTANLSPSENPEGFTKSWKLFIVRTTLYF